MKKIYFYITFSLFFTACSLSLICGAVDNNSLSVLTHKYCSYETIYEENFYETINQEKEEADSLLKKKWNKWHWGLALGGTLVLAYVGYNACKKSDTSDEEMNYEEDTTRFERSPMQEMKEISVERREKVEKLFSCDCVTSQLPSLTARDILELFRLPQDRALMKRIIAKLLNSGTYDDESVPFAGLSEEQSRLNSLTDEELSSLINLAIALDKKIIEKREYRRLVATFLYSNIMEELNIRTLNHVLARLSVPSNAKERARRLISLFINIRDKIQSEYQNGNLILLLATNLQHYSITLEDMKFLESLDDELAKAQTLALPEEGQGSLFDAMRKIVPSLDEATYKKWGGDSAAAPLRACILCTSPYTRESRIALSTHKSGNTYCQFHSCKKCLKLHLGASQDNWCPFCRQDLSIGGYEYYTTFDEFVGRKIMFDFRSIAYKKYEQIEANKKNALRLRVQNMSFEELRNLYLFNMLYVQGILSPSVQLIKMKHGSCRQILSPSALWKRLPWGIDRLDSNAIRCPFCSTYFSAFYKEGRGNNEGRKYGFNEALFNANNEYFTFHMFDEDFLRSNEDLPCELWVKEYVTNVYP